MEQPVAVDGPTSKRMIELARLSKEQNMKVGVGLMARHCRARQALVERIRNGEIGDIIHLRSYRMHGPVGSVFTGRRKEDLSELLWQIKRFQSFLWTSGGLFNDLYLHKIDECCWMKNSWPVRAEALGGRHYRGDNVDQNFDNYAVEYTFADGGKFSFRGRIMVGARDQYASYVHGSKGIGIVSAAGNFPARCRTFNGHNISPSGLIWSSSQPESNPHDLEWEDFLGAIVGGESYHELERGVMAALVACMGRKAAHTGQEVTLDEMLNDEHEFAPGLDQLTMDSPAPLQANAEGRYPVPMPGLKQSREY
jgi:predicted dehydrogenase